MLSLVRSSLLNRSSSSSSSSSATLSAKGLYKYLYRQCARIPNPELQKYYRHHIRQSYIQHADESDPERINHIIKQAVKDWQWVLKKYKI